VVDNVGGQPIARPSEQIPDDERRSVTATAKVENINTAGAADGSIIAAVIVTQIPRNQPSAPRSVPGPASIPRIRSTSAIHARSAVPTREAASAGRLRRLRRPTIASPRSDYRAVEPGA
jgi:hypothetical protein